MVALNYAEEYAPRGHALTSGVPFLSSNQLPPLSQAQLAALEDADRARDSGFWERALESRERAEETGVYFSAEEVLAGLEARLVAAIAKCKK